MFIYIESDIKLIIIEFLQLKRPNSKKIIKRNEIKQNIQGNQFIKLIFRIISSSNEEIRVPNQQKENYRGKLEHPIKQNILRIFALESG
jgi:hypothetical protein